MVNYRPRSVTATSPGQSPLMKPVQFLMLYHTDMVESSASLALSHTGLVPSPLHRPRLPECADIGVTKVSQRGPEAGPGCVRAPRRPPRAIREAHGPGSISPDPGTAPAVAGSAPAATGALPQSLPRGRGCRRGPRRGPRAPSRRAAGRRPVAHRDRLHRSRRGSRVWAGSSKW